MDFLVNLANGLTGIVSAGADNLVGLLTGILPNVLILLTLINAIVALIGEERVMRVAKKITRFRILRYTVIPFMGLFFFTNPMRIANRLLLTQSLHLHIQLQESFHMPIPVNYLYGWALRQDLKR